MTGDEKNAIQIYTGLNSGATIECRKTWPARQLAAAAAAVTWADSQRSCGRQLSQALQALLSSQISTLYSMKMNPAHLAPQLTTHHCPSDTTLQQRYLRPPTALA